MKKLFKTILIIIAAATLVFMVNFIALAMFHKGMPYTWNIKGYIVVDSSYYGNQYYQVNDTIRVIAEAGIEVYFDKYVVYVIDNNEWTPTTARTYKTTHDNMYQVFHFLRSQYNDYLYDKKHPKTQIIWEYN